jgi:hypothetical protein
LNTKPKATTSESTKRACKKLKITNELEELENLNTIEVFDKKNKSIDGASIARGDFVLVKCYIRYWKHYTSKHHRLTLELTVIKQLIKSK